MYLQLHPENICMLQLYAWAMVTMHVLISKYIFTSKCTNNIIKTSFRGGLAWIWAVCNQWTGLLDWTTGTTFDLFAHAQIPTFHHDFTYHMVSYSWASLFMMGKAESPSEREILLSKMSFAVKLGVHIMTTEIALTAEFTIFEEDYDFILYIPQQQLLIDQ